ncbi:hypothetical protein BP6252_08199 [Coleophoma cylindrospora]|uniref:Uncharacterized protein n=1 Tax=Coleophoma cylindrospora TaxID=1849047 RepID=A0A3D8RCF7_9HELO|nr:hypothetical protein BP6252_08199 [Coleophoma cylindrospora]
MYTKYRVISVLFLVLSLTYTVSGLPGQVSTKRAGTAQLNNKMFQGSSQVDAVSLLLLLGEAMVWKAVWGRYRSRRYHWKQWVFAISPGWAPLAVSLFATMSGSLGPKNLIFERPPEGCIDNGLILTNLNSGASHSASNTIIQNIWHTWNKGARNQLNPRKREHVFDLTREIGIADVNLDCLYLQNRPMFCFQALCLLIQFTGSLALGLCGYSLETFVVLVVALIGQGLLLLSVTPREKSWTMTTRGHRQSAVMLHKGLDTTAALIIRTTTSGGRDISLEEYCWDNQASRDYIDTLKRVSACISFLVLALHILLIGWMSSEGKYFYLAFGGLGLLANTMEAATEPEWSVAFRVAFSKHALCASLHSSLMAAVAILLAGRFPSATKAAKLLYPDNSRFQQSLDDLNTHIDCAVCENCRQSIREPRRLLSHPCSLMAKNTKCAFQLSARGLDLDSKQLADGLAAVQNYLLLMDPALAGAPPSETRDRMFSKIDTS